MSASAKFRILLGDNDSVKLTLPSGIPKTIEELKTEIKKQCGVTGDFRLQYLDTDFEDYVNLTSTVDLQDKATIKVLTQRSFDVCSLSSADTDIRSSSSSPTPCSVVAASQTDSSGSASESMSSSTMLRSETWPTNFPIPQFPYEVELELQRAHEEFLQNGTSIKIESKPKLKTEILKSLAAEILKYKVYPRSDEYEDVAKALIAKYPCLKEKGSACGFFGWKVSLQWKMGNYRRTLRAAGCPEIKINSLKRRPDGECTHSVQFKKPKKAEVNFYPDYPAGEDKESLEKERLALLSEIQKKDNQQTIKQKMDKTFAYRRHEVVQDMPFIAEFKSRWPALFCEHQMATEFTRITTLPLIQTFMSKLDGYTNKLTRVFRKKGGAAGRKICELMSVIDEHDTTSTRRACILKSLSVYLNEDNEKLMKEYIDVDIEKAERDMANTVIGIFIVRAEGAGPEEPPLDVGIIVEGVKVLQELGDVTKACALLLAVIYSLNLSYPSDLKYTFEFLQKVLMELDANKLSHKIQVLKNKLME